MAGPIHRARTIPILRRKHGLTSDTLVEKVLPLLKKTAGNNALQRGPERTRLCRRSKPLG
jgi:hypothetical protein